MVRNDRSGALEPEGRDLREHLPLVGNSRREDVIKRGDPIGRNDQEPVAEIVQVSDLALSIGNTFAKRTLKKRRRQRQQNFLVKRSYESYMGTSEPDNNNM